MPLHAPQVLFNLYETLVASTSDPLAPNRQRRVLEAVGLFATIAPPELVAAFFGRLFKVLSESFVSLQSDASGTRVATHPIPPQPTSPQSLLCPSLAAPYPRRYYTHTAPCQC